MVKPVLIIMAAGMGSRYGGLKQMDSVDSAGHSMLDFSVYDAVKAGFESVICIVSPALEKDFREIVGKRIEPYVDIKYAVQSLDALPEGFSVPEGRQKPWGTAHAVLSAKGLVNAPFAVINADDFYGRGAFEAAYDFLVNSADHAHHAMVGYRLENTLTENGHVARGVCEVDENGNLTGITERTHIEKRPDGAAFTEDGENFVSLPADTLVSMNMWGFGQSMMAEIERRFGDFLSANLQGNPLKCEYFLPFVPNELIKAGLADVKVLPTTEKWHGVTYAQDMPQVREAIEDMKKSGVYPELLWSQKVQK